MALPSQYSTFSGAASYGQLGTDYDAYEASKSANGGQHPTTVAALKAFTATLKACHTELGRSLGVLKYC